MSTEEITWTEEALRRVENAPDFVRPGIYKLMVKKAKERGYKVITSEFLTEIRNESMMLASQRMKRLGFDELRIEAFDEAKKKMKNARKAEVIEQIKGFLSQRTEKNEEIIEKFRGYLNNLGPATSICWTPEALDRLNRLPVFVREMAKGAIEREAEKRGIAEVTQEFMKQVYDNILPDAIKKMIKRKDGEG